MPVPLSSPALLIVLIWQTRSNPAYGQGSITAPYSTLKTETVAPIPSARERIAVKEKPGFFHTCRKAKRRSCQSVCMRTSLSERQYVYCAFWQFNDHRKKH